MNHQSLTTRLKSALSKSWERVRHNELLVRAFHTFWQAAFGYVVSHALKLEPIVGTAALSAGAAAVKALVLSYFGPDNG